jgi:hypothetical protein
MRLLRERPGNGNGKIRLCQMMKADRDNPGNWRLPRQEDRLPSDRLLALGRDHEATKLSPST